MENTYFFVFKLNYQIMTAWRSLEKETLQIVSAIIYALKNVLEQNK